MPEDIQALAVAMRRDLAAVANRKATIFYGDLMTMHGLDHDNQHHRNILSQVLGIISTEAVRGGLPMLSAVVVNKSGEHENSPSPPFFALAKELRRMQRGESELAFLANELNAVHRRTW